MNDKTALRWTPEKNYKLFDAEREQLKDSQHHSPWCFCEECREKTDAVAEAPEPEANEELAAYTANYVLEQIRLMTATVRKANRTPMAQRQSGARTAPQPERKNDGIQRLEASELSNQRKIAFQIEWAGDPSKVGPSYDWMRVSVKLRSVNKGIKRIYTVGDNNPVCDVLYSACGHDVSAWVGRIVLAWRAIVQPSEKQYVRFTVVPAGQTVTDEMLKVSPAEASGEDIQETSGGGADEDIPF